MSTAASVQALNRAYGATGNLEVASIDSMNTLNKSQDGFCGELTSEQKNMTSIAALQETVATWVAVGTVVAGAASGAGGSVGEATTGIKSAIASTVQAVAQVVKGGVETAPAYVYVEKSSADQGMGAISAGATGVSGLTDQLQQGAATPLDNSMQGIGSVLVQVINNNTQSCSGG